MRKVKTLQRQSSRVKALRVYEHIIFDELELELAMKAKSLPEKSFTAPAPSPAAPERDAIEIARTAGALLKRTA